MQPVYAKIEYAEGEIIIRIPISAKVVILPVMPKLTNAETAILEAMGPTHSRRVKEIARAVGISERGTKFHISNILRKFGVETRGEL